MIFGKKREKPILLVTVSVDHLRTAEEQENELNNVKERFVKTLKEMGRQDDFDLLVVPNSINCQIAG